ncbi:MAG: hypothetical protein JW739_02675 [Opitutales bacterium]|nr:hypothetical protein [Opitutales bacterium]
MKQILSISLFSLSILLASGCTTTVGKHTEYTQDRKETHNYKGGPIGNPNSNDVEEALNFGQKSQNNHLLEDAYTIIWKSSSFDRSVKIIVETPIYRIAEHAQKRAREFRHTDSRYINSICQQGVITLSAAKDSAINSRIFNQKALLIRDGIRIEPISRLSLSYSIEEISKPGNYAIVIRDTGKRTSSFKEIKIPISFEDFR